MTMALPTTPGYWSSRKGMYERAIVRQRNHESDFRQKWSETSDYFHKNNVLAAKQTEWGSGKAGKAYQNRCIDTFHQSCERDLKAMNLRRRQEKLKSLLMDESRQYEAELKGLSRPNYDRMEEMKERAEDLRSAREEKRKQIADEKLYEHWQKNNPDVRQIHSELMRDHVVGHWPQQQEEARVRAEEERKAKEEIEKQMEEERMAALEAERQKEEERLREEFELRDHLKRQMMELKSREAEAQELKHQHDLLLREQWEMERVEAHRRQKEEQRRKMDLGRALLRQHKTQMMHKSKLIQEELELDKRLLEDMIEKEKEEISLQTARLERREELLRELEIANQLTQREQEKAQEEQLVFKQELKEQIVERQNIEKVARLNLQQEEEEERQADREYQDFLRQETDRMRQRGFTPQIAGRKQAWS